MKAITLTLNPAFDMHCYTENFQPYHENLAEVTSLDAGGKGVNIARALTENRVEQLAVVVLGEENKPSFVKALGEYGIAYRDITVPGRIRENITLHTEGAEETRISFAGFSVEDTLLNRIEELLEPYLERDTILTFTGRNPEGMTLPAAVEFLKRLMKKGTRVVIDSRSFSKEALVEVKPWLIKPNQEEISAYLGNTVNSLEEARHAAKELYQGGIENVMISLGGQGALLYNAQGCFAASAPRIRLRSTIGAGDSSIGGFIAAAVAKKSPEEMLRTAVAFGSAACMREGTNPPLPQDIQALLAEISVSKLCG